MRLALLLSCAVVAFGCLPKAGDNCTEHAGCDGALAALFCEAGTLKSYQCAAGCTETPAAWKCSFFSSQPGTACPVAVINTGFCLSGDAGAMLCKSAGVSAGLQWTKEPCSGCEDRVSGVYCR